MKTKQLFLTTLLAVTFYTAKAQIGNTIYGVEAGDHIINGSHNTYIGSNSGGINYNGNNNVFIGDSSGYESENGSNNTYLGYYSGLNSQGSNNIFLGNKAGMNESGNNKLYVENSDSAFPLIWGDFALDLLKFNGKVGIGYGFGNFPTTAGSVDVSNYNLFVKGGILTEEVRVNLQSDWADYVFHKNYNLKSLEEVEAFISQNKHLPNMPSAKQVKEEGIELGEMIKMQQEKIEELPLYLLQLNKENQEEKEQNKILLKKLSDLEEKVNLLLTK